VTEPAAGLYASPVALSSEPVARIYRRAGMAQQRGRQHASGIAAQPTPIAGDRDQAIAAFQLERHARTLLAEQIHDGIVQNIAAALLMLSTVVADAGTGERLERSIEIIRAAFNHGRREVFGSLSPLDRSLQFILQVLLEESGTPGQVTAPDTRHPREQELAVFQIVQDVLLFNGERRPVAVRVVERQGALLGAIRLAGLRDVDRLAVALDHRLRLRGGFTVCLPNGRGLGFCVPDQAAASIRQA
jgi:hypothetical protein